MTGKILVVADEQEMVELIRFNLQAHGCEVLVARDGIRALNLARQFLPDLVLLDLMLERMDGFTVCEILRRQPSTANIPVIMVTALNGQLARANGIGAGASDYITKPFTPGDLLQRVETALLAGRKRTAAVLTDPP